MSRRFTAPIITAKSPEQLRQINTQFHFYHSKVLGQKFWLFAAFGIRNSDASESPSADRQFVELLSDFGGEP